MLDVRFEEAGAELKSQNKNLKSKNHSIVVGTDQLALGLAQSGALEEVGAVAARLAERRAAPPACGLRVVAAEQNLGHAPAAKLDGARVVREVENPFGEGFVDRRGLAPQRARHEPRDRV